MNKLQNKAQSSKLNITKKKQDKITSISRKKTSEKQIILSFAFDNSSSSNLQELLERVNSLSQKKINASHLIRALIYLGKKARQDKLIKALKEVNF